MTSKEIARIQQDMSLNSPDFPLWEIAYQLAYANEKEDREEVRSVEQYSRHRRAMYSHDKD